MAKVSSKNKQSRFKKSLYTLASLAALMGTPKAFAQIPPTAFKNFSKHYKKKEYDLVLGAATLESGFIYNLRFFGNFTPGQTPEGNRDYINDHSEDPLWNLTKLLFPSPAGQLTTERAVETNFGKNATPKTIALLQNFAHSLREGKAPTDEEIIENILASFNKDFKSQENSEIVALKENLKNFTEPKKGLALTNLKPLFKANSGKPLWKALESDFKKIINKSAQSFEEKKQALLGALNAHLTQKEAAGIKEKKASYEKEIKDLIAHLKNAISQEGTSLYPARMPEQILSAFFDRHFNTQNDIREYMESLDDTIVDKTNLSKKDDYLKAEDLPSIANKTNPYELDEIYDLTQGAIFTSPVPYKPGTSFVNNGNADKYDRKNDKLIPTTIPDCVETAARHFMNLALYNPLKREFDLTPFEEEKSPYIKNLKAFYSLQSPQEANNGDSKIRSAWNKVVGDLNAFGGNDIRYKQGTNELDAGFINFIRVFEKILGLSLGAPGSTPWVKASLEAILKAINSTRDYIIQDITELKQDEGDLSGTLRIQVKDKKSEQDLFSFDLYSKPNLHGEARNLTIPNLETSYDNYQLLYKKTIFQEDTTTQAIWLSSKNESVRQEKVSYPLYQLFEQPLMDNKSKLAFLQKIGPRFHEWKSSSFLSNDLKLENFKKTLGNILEDISWEDQFVFSDADLYMENLSRFKELEEIIYKNVKKQFLKKVSIGDPSKNIVLEELKKLSSWRKDLFISGLNSDEEMARTIEENLRKAFKGASWDNPTVVSELSSIILELLKVNNLRSLFEEEVKGLSLNSYDGSFSSLPSSLASTLTTLECALQDVSQVADLGKFMSLKRLNLRFSPKHDKLFLPELKNLEVLKIDAEHIKALDLKGLENLKELDAQGSEFTPSLSSLSSLETMNNLEVLNLYRSRIEGNLNIKGLKSLKKLNVGRTPLESLTLENLENLETVNLMESRVSNLSIKGCPTLKNLQLTNMMSMMSKSTQAPLSYVLLEQLDDLKSLNFAGTKVSELTLKGLKKLNSLTLSDEVSTLSLEDVNSLENVGFFKAKTLPTIKGGQNLKGINAVSALFTSFSLTGLENLKMLNLMNSKVSSIENIEQDMKNLTINLKGSGINKSNYKTAIKGWEHLDESKLIF